MFGFRSAPEVTSNYRVPPAEILLGAKAERRVPSTAPYL